MSKPGQNKRVAMNTSARDLAVTVDESALLGLQGMEQALVRARLAYPSGLTSPGYDLLRYALRLAALDCFAPGATSGRSKRPDVRVDQTLVAPLREFLLRSLSVPLQPGGVPKARIAAAAALLPEISAGVCALREQLLQRYAGELSAGELDDEIAHKKLVLIAGGGGGAGYVYVGALARLAAEGLYPGYIVGSSIGALLGAFIARQRQPDYHALLAVAKGLTFPDVFAKPRGLAQHNLPGLMRLHLRGAYKELESSDGEALRLRDLEIPYEAVICGIRARFYDRMPGLLRAAQPLGRPLRVSGQFAERAWQLTTLLTPNLLDEIVLGRDADTQQFDAIEAAGWSAALPGVLQFDPWRRSPRMRQLLAELCQERQLAAIVDGGAANNVPAKTAWRGVRSGKIGTRNAYYLAFDSFRPQAHHKHILLWPVTQAVQLQLAANRPYFDWLLQFAPTLSPANFLPSPTDLDRAWNWGWQQMSAVLPMVLKAMEPVDLRALPWRRDDSEWQPHASLTITHVPFEQRQTHV